MNRATSMRGLVSCRIREADIFMYAGRGESGIVEPFFYHICIRDTGKNDTIHNPNIKLQSVTIRQKEFP
jgi:hypothetical protein